MAAADLEHAPGVAEARGDETMLLDLASGKYFSLNAVGGRFWQLIDSGQSPAQTRAAVVAAMAGKVRGKGVFLGLFKR